MQIQKQPWSVLYLIQIKKISFEFQELSNNQLGAFNKKIKGKNILLNFILWAVSKRQSMLSKRNFVNKNLCNATESRKNVWKQIFQIYWLLCKYKITYSFL